MAKFKLKLVALPEFDLPVSFNLPNGEKAEIKFKVKHLKASEVKELYTQKKEVKDHEFIQAIATDWDLEEEFNEENIKELVSLFPSSALALTSTYVQALAGNRVKD